MKAAPSRSLPPPEWSRLGDLGEALLARRSVRAYRGHPLPEEDLSLILAAACGVSDRTGRLRTAPSGGACYPLDTYLVNADGVFGYVPESHALVRVRAGDVRPDLAAGAYNQNFLLQAPVTVAVCADYPRITGRYGRRGVRYAIQESGHIAQNVHLAATSLGYGSVAVGAFDDAEIAAILGVDAEPLYLIPVGMAAE